MCSLNSSANKVFAPNERFKKPSHLVSPENQNGTASANLSASIVSDSGMTPKMVSVKRATAPGAPLWAATFWFMLMIFSLNLKL